MRVLAERRDFTLEGLITAAYDSYLPAMEQLIPPLLKAYDAMAAGSAKDALARPIAALRGWDYRFGVASVAMTVADAYGTDISAAAAAGARAANQPVLDYIGAGSVPAETIIATFTRSIARLNANFGSWQTPWGDVNRFQRLSGAIDAGFDDSKPSLPVAFASANWGSLAAYGQTGVRTTKKYYGNRGNSFVAAVEFGPRVRAKSVLAGGVHSDPSSPYFFNQGERYATGTFKDVAFYAEDVRANAVRTYRPGSR